MKPENVECNVFLKYNLRALNAEKRNDLKIPPREFIPPNDKTNEIPKAASSRDFITDDEDDIEIVISSDEEFDDELLDWENTTFFSQSDNSSSNFSSEEITISLS